MSDPRVIPLREQRGRSRLPSLDIEGLGSHDDDVFGPRVTTSASAFSAAQTAPDELTTAFADFASTTDAFDIDMIEALSAPTRLQPLPVLAGLGGETQPQAAVPCSCPCEPVSANHSAPGRSVRSTCVALHMVARLILITPCRPSVHVGTSPAFARSQADIGVNVAHLSRYTLCVPQLHDDLGTCASAAMRRLCAPEACLATSLEEPLCAISDFVGLGFEV